MDANSFMAIAERFGIPIAILLVVMCANGFAIYKICSWLGPRADKLIDKHIAVMDQAITSLKAVEESQAEQLKYSKSIHRHLKQKKESA